MKTPLLTKAPWAKSGGQPAPHPWQRSWAIPALVALCAELGCAAAPRALSPSPQAQPTSLAESAQLTAYSRLGELLAVAGVTLEGHPPVTQVEPRDTRAVNCPLARELAQQVCELAQAVCALQQEGAEAALGQRCAAANERCQRARSGTDAACSGR